MLATWHFHIEISSKCTLRCPRCARQEVPDTLINTELDLDFFRRNFHEEFVVNNVEKITFCGDDGDPIYAHDLTAIIRYLKSIKPVEIVIVTNGSHRRSDWWADLAATLSHRDSVHFSVDGYDNVSNNLYRVNSNYDSIVTGITTLRSLSDCEIVWAAIAFKFNQDHLDQMKQIAQSLGVDRFQLTRSTKFAAVYPSYGPHDTLQPSANLVSQSHRFEREITDLSQRPASTKVSATNLALYKKIQSQNGVTPLCEIGNKGLYIDARGRLFPCCWVANRYNHNSQWQQLADRFDLNKHTIEQALADSFWQTEFKSFHWQECQTKCQTKLVDEKYATTW